MACQRLKPLSKHPIQLGVLLALPLATGCEQVCVGVGCEEDFGSARISLVAGADVPESGIANPAEGTFVLTGTDALGPNWDVVVLNERILVGSSSDSSVRSYTPGGENTIASSSATGRIDGNRTDDQFGTQVKTIRNRDGKEDLLVSAPLASASASTRHDGAVYRFSDLGQGFAGQRSADDAILRMTGEWSGGRFGTSLAVCPDLDGDGLEEWMAAAPRDGKTAPLAGQVVLVQSGDLSEDTNQIVVSILDTRWTGVAVGEMAGHALSCKHDLTGDGIPDLVIGAPYADQDAEVDASGAIYILSGDKLQGSGPLPEVATITLQPGESNDWFGWSLTTGDFDGDGTYDLAAGAPGTAEATGRVRIWTGATLASEDPTNPDITINGLNPGDGFGRRVHAADVNGDGIDDLLVGAPFVNPTGLTEAFDAGSVALFFGSNDVVEWSLRSNALNASVLYEEAAQYLRTGIALFSGDFDSDGLDDIVFLQRTSEE